MRKIREHVISYLKILGLSVLFFGVIDLMGYWRYPIDKRPLIVNIKLAIVVIVFSILIFIILEFIIPFYRRRLIKKLHQKFNGSTIVEPLKLKIKVNDQLNLVFFAVEMSEQNEIILEYTGNDKHDFDKLIKERAVKRALVNCKNAKSEVKRVYNALTKLMIELNKTGINNP